MIRSAVASNWPARPDEIDAHVNPELAVGVPHFKRPPLCLSLLLLVLFFASLLFSLKQNPSYRLHQIKALEFVTLSLLAATSVDYKGSEFTRITPNFLPTRPQIVPFLCLFWLGSGGGASPDLFRESACCLRSRYISFHFSRSFPFGVRAAEVSVLGFGSSIPSLFSWYLF